mmetsp:Transcript_29957/g.77591  ORF Transcript_29957/g.77591 Transcript_29957/m.77591 type:complete len:334 (+) Transcript_29957:2578-3579(+)
MARTRSSAYRKWVSTPRPLSHGAWRQSSGASTIFPPRRCQPGPASGLSRSLLCPRAERQPRMPPLDSLVRGAPCACRTCSHLSSSRARTPSVGNARQSAPRRGMRAARSAATRTCSTQTYSPSDASRGAPRMEAGARAHAAVPSGRWRRSSHPPPARAARRTTATQTSLGILHSAHQYAGAPAWRERRARIETVRKAQSERIWLRDRGCRSSISTCSLVGVQTWSGSLEWYSTVGDRCPTSKHYQIWFGRGRDPSSRRRDLGRWRRSSDDGMLALARLVQHARDTIGLEVHVGAIGAVGRMKGEIHFCAFPRAAQRSMCVVAEARVPRPTRIG